MTTAVPAFILPTIASGKKPTGVGEPVTTLMPNVPSARPVYTGSVIGAPSNSSLQVAKTVGYES